MVALMEVVLLFSSLFLIIFVFSFSPCFYFNMELQTEKVVIGLG